MCEKDLKIKNYTLTVDFESPKSIDSKRKVEISNLYNNSSFNKVKEVLFYENLQSNGKFHSNGFIIKENEIDRLNYVAKELEKIFSIKFEKKSNKISIDIYYILENLEGDFGFIEQIEAITNLVGNKDMFIANIEILQFIEKELAVFIKLGVSTKGLTIKVITELESLKELKKVVNKIDEYVFSKLIHKLVKEEEVINGTKG